MANPLNFQQVILKLHEYWAAQDCVIWEPYNVQVGAGTGNPATTLRVLGPEPWRVAYVEPSVRPDDGRFGENPNRMQKYYQYQVILKPDPGNPQELYLASLAALGIKEREHDIRFVEDNWESPALGAWGLGWEVWLDGQEITQFTYFQQAGGMTLDPVSVEITYGIERIVLALQGKDSAWEIDWLDGVNYGDMMFNEEVEHCRYYFDVADVSALKQVYDTYEREYSHALEGDALISAYDYVLKCSHLFNVLDTRGAIGVTERANYFRRMREMTRTIATEFVQKRESMGYPLMKMAHKWKAPPAQVAGNMPAAPTAAADLLIEIGMEEMPADDVAAALAQVEMAAPLLFDSLRLARNSVNVFTTPRRIVITVEQLAAKQTDEEFVAKGPPTSQAYDAAGNPTRAAIGFARGKGVNVDELEVSDIDGASYVTVKIESVGRSTIEVLAENLPPFLATLKFDRSMRWNDSGVEFSRPIRWIVALFGETQIPFAYAGVASGTATRGLRPNGSPTIPVGSLQSYLSICKEQGILLDCEERKRSIQHQMDYELEFIQGQYRTMGAVFSEDETLLTEVANLVEAPTTFRGVFDEVFLNLPADVLKTVMRKHQRYFAVEDTEGGFLCYFIGVRNGDREHLDKVIHGNEQVIRARFSDASFFYRADIKKPLRAYLPRLDTLTFQAELGSMRAKNDRVAATIVDLGELLGFAREDIDIAGQAAQIAKADLATSMVVEMTSLQGIMGREYALREGINPAVARAIAEHWLPGGAGSQIPASAAGRLLSLADKLDSLVGLLAVGLAPKSTSDPYGLRRSALGILRILVEGRICADLRPAIKRVGEAQPVEVGSDMRMQVLEFLTGRLDNWLSEKLSVPRDVISAVLAEQAANPFRAVQGIEELAHWVGKTDWESILDSFARCARITRNEEAQSFDLKLLKEPQERSLYEAYSSSVKNLGDADNIDGFLARFQGMVLAITDFFDHVLVHVDDSRLRNNRIALLQLISSMQRGRADLSELDNF
ncbi:MAG: glycine--tRNA ligase subunit beta [Chloroflexi bacterium]|nr:glycine--tRNA ligase subunit beta [Chloroflexota bacterium]